MMGKQLKAFRLSIFLSITILIFSCSKKEVALPDNLVVFETASQSFVSNENEINIKLRLTRAENSAGNLTLKVTETGVQYASDYTTTPAVNAGMINVPVPAGSTEVTVAVTKTPSALYDGDEKLEFELVNAGAGLFIGQTKSYTLNFDEIAAQSGSAIIDGGGPAYPNKVFIDLSANRQVAVQRVNWDLGFYMDADGFRVILNSSLTMMAKRLDKSSMNDVNTADTAGFSNEVAFSQTNPRPEQLAYIDYPDGDLTKTAIAAISSVADENKVYIINRGSGIGNPAPARGWKKIRVLRNNNGGYILQHADIGATTFQEIAIAKDDKYYFKYISFENAPADVEPQKEKWDIAWSYFANVTNFGTGEVPYMFQDIVLQNRNVQTAKVLTSTKAFDDFKEADLGSVTWNSSKASIGADWRAGGGPSSAPAVRTDRFYIIKDGAGNIYKLRFTALTSNGERGYPAYETVLIKKA